MNWKLKTITPETHFIDFEGVKSGWTARVLVMSDEHVDNAKCDRALIEIHHNEAAETGSPILKFGDTFCAMQGKWDKRSDTTQCRPEHQVNNYLDALVKTTADFYRPWKNNIALITPGNHEASIANRHQTDLIDRLLERMGNKPSKGAYSGFVRFRFGRHYANESKTLRWHHGYGGGGEITRGLIDNSRTRGQCIADIYYSGHIHRRNLDENIIQELTQRGQIKERQQWFLRGSCYKDEHKGGGGWHAEQGRTARPKGGWWLNFRADGDRVIVTPTPAL